MKVIHARILALPYKIRLSVLFVILSCFVPFAIILAVLLAIRVTFKTLTGVKA
jgi:hypothetical protein